MKELPLRSIPPHTITSQRARSGVSGAARQAWNSDLPRQQAGQQAGLRSRFHSRVSRADILIPPRRPAGPSHEIVETATEYLVRVTFPGDVSLDALQWEMTGDVLEVEYAAPGLHYFQDFLIPAPSAPSVSVHGCVFVAEFSKVS